MSKQTNTFAYADRIGYLHAFDRAKAQVIATWRSTNGGEPHDLERILRVDDAADGPLYIEATRNYASGKVRYDEISAAEADRTVAAWRELAATPCTAENRFWLGMYDCTFA